MFLIGKYLSMCCAVRLVTQLCLTLCDPTDHPPSLYLKKIFKSQFQFYSWILVNWCCVSGIMLGTRTTKINKTWILPLRSKLIYIIYTLEWWSNRGKVRASVVIQMVKNPPAMQETCLQFLGWEDFPEEGIATHSSIFAWRIPMDRDAWQATVYGVAKSQTQLRD